MLKNLIFDRGGVRVWTVVENGDLWFAVQTPYSAEFVRKLKDTVPSFHRRWVPFEKVWLINQGCLLEISTACIVFFPNYDYFELIKALRTARRNFNHTQPFQSSEPKETTITVEYIAATKNGWASGSVDGSWQVSISESALREWFNDPEPEREPRTLFEVLGIAETATDAEIKAGYKASVRRWHPDVCKAADARERFERVKKAWDVLSNPQTRSLYLAGLKIEQQSGQAEIKPPYRSPKNNGRLRVLATEKNGRLEVTKIYSWEEVRNDSGAVLISSYSKGGVQCLWV